MLEILSMQNVNSVFLEAVQDENVPDSLSLVSMIWIRENWWFGNNKGANQPAHHIKICYTRTFTILANICS